MADDVPLHTFPGVKTTGKLETELIVSENNEAGNGDNLIIRTGTGDATAGANLSGNMEIYTNHMIPFGLSGDINIYTGNANQKSGDIFINIGTSTTDNGGDITIAAGNGAINGGNLLLTAGDGTAGVDGDITLHAHGGDVNFNSAIDVVLDDDFTKEDVIGGMNELMSLIQNNPSFNDIDYEEGVYSSTVNLTSAAGVPTNITSCVINVSEGTWLVSYSFVVTNSVAGTTTSPTLAYVENTTSATIIDESKSLGYIPISLDDVCITKKFVYNVASGSGSQTLQLVFVTNTLLAGTCTNSIEMTSVVADKICQVPSINAIKISNVGDNDYQQNTYTVIANIAYNGVTEVAVPGVTLAVTTGTWMIGYCFSARIAAAADATIAYLRDGGAVILDDSKSFAQNSINDSRLCVNKTFIATFGADTTLSLYFRLDVSVSVSDAIEMSGFSSVANPCQVPLIWGFKLNTQNEYYTNTYTGAGIDYTSENGVAIMDVGITFDSGTWLVGYDVTINSSAPNIYSTSWFANSISTFTDVGAQYDKSFNFFRNSVTNDRMLISKSFIANFNTSSGSSNLYNIYTAIVSGVNTNEAVSTAILAGIANPDQVPMIWAIKLNNSTQLRFIDLADTPKNYGTSGLPVITTGTSISYGPSIVTVTNLDFSAMTFLNLSNVSGVTVSGYTVSFYNTFSQMFIQFVPTITLGPVEGASCAFSYNDVGGIIPGTTLMTQVTKYTYIISGTVASSADVIYNRVTTTTGRFIFINAHASVHDELINVIFNLP